MALFDEIALEDHTEEVQDMTVAEALQISQEAEEFEIALEEAREVTSKIDDASAMIEKLENRVSLEERLAEEGEIGAAAVALSMENLALTYQEVYPDQTLDTVAIEAEEDDKSRFKKITGGTKAILVKIGLFIRKIVAKAIAMGKKLMLKLMVAMDGTRKTAIELRKELKGISGTAKDFDESKAKKIYTNTAGMSLGALGNYALAFSRPVLNTFKGPLTDAAKGENTLGTPEFKKKIAAPGRVSSKVESMKLGGNDGLINKYVFDKTLSKMKEIDADKDPVGVVVSTNLTTVKMALISVKEGKLKINFTTLRLKSKEGKVSVPSISDISGALETVSSESKALKKGVSDNEQTLKTIEETISKIEKGTGKDVEIIAKNVNEVATLAANLTIEEMTTVYKLNRKIVWFAKLAIAQYGNEEKKDKKDEVEIKKQ